jgi:hypothetical protein
MPVAFAAASLACRTMTYVLTDGRDSCLLESAQGLLNKLRQPGPRVSVIREASSLRIGN